MQFTTVALAALAGAATISASPIKEQNTKRACTVQYPEAIGFPIHYNITKAPGFDQPNYLTFSNIPANAGGPCSLITVFPAGYPITYGSNGSPLVNVFAIDGPAPGALVGSTQFVSDPNAPKVSTINSFACRPSMTFKLDIDAPQGSVSFLEIEGAGLQLTYSC